MENNRFGIIQVGVFEQANSAGGSGGGDEEEVVIEVPQDPTSATVWSTDQPPVNINTTDVPTSGATVIYTPDPGKH